MTTRDKILGKSQELFNRNGIGKVSVRSICEELGISLGNFTYYFPDKQKIVIELYHRMIEEMEWRQDRVTQNRNSILYLLEYHKELFTIQNKYKFFFLNTFELIHHSSEIKEAYFKYVQKEKRRMKQLLQYYLSHGVLKENTEVSFLDRLVKVSLMVGSFWMIDAELHFKGKENKKLKHYLELCCSLIEPHLSADSLKVYKMFFKKLG